MSPKNANGQRTVISPSSPTKYIIRFLQSTYDFCVKLLLSVIILIVSPFLLALSVPMFLYRLLVKFSAPVFRKDLRKMLTTRGQLFAVDDILGAPKCNIVVTVVLEGAVDWESIKDALVQRVFEDPPKDSKGNVRYPELSQYLVNYGGYYFWKDDETFNIDNHYTVLDNPSGYTAEDLQNLAKKYVGRKWLPQRPMWQLVLISNYISDSAKSPGDPHSAILMTIHHSMGDGYSFLYFIIETVCQMKSLVNVVPNYFKRAWPLMLLYYVTFPFRASWETAGVIFDGLKSYALRADEPYDKFKLVGPEGTNLNLGSSKPIPLSLVKDIKSHFNTSFAAVQFSAIAGALREFHIQKGMVLHDVMPCLTVVPYPGHQLNKFRNHMGAVIISLPIKEPHPVKRLQLCQNDYNRCKRSTFPIATFYSLGILGWLVSPLARAIIKAHFIPTGLSSFPGGLEHMSLHGHKAVECLAYAGMMEGNAGVCFVSISYVDVFRFSVTGKSSIFSQLDLQRLIELIEINLNTLHQKIKIHV